MCIIFNYTDYRDFMRDFYQMKRKEGSFFSYRYMGQKLNLDPSYIVKLFKKKVHLSSKSIPTVVKFYKFDEKEIEYFELILLYNKTKLLSEKQILYNKILTFTISKLSMNKMSTSSYFKKWYHMLLYVYSTKFIITDDIKKIIDSFHFPITEEELTETIVLLKRLNLLTQRKDGAYFAPANAAITYDENIDESIKQEFQTQLLQLGEKAIYETPREEQKTNAITIPISTEAQKILYDKIDQFVSDLKDILVRDLNSEYKKLFQFNIHAFPLQKKPIHCRIDENEDTD